MMLEIEASALLRRSRSHVKRLRLERKLGYYPGRPVLISQSDLEAYVAWAKVRRVPRAAPLKLPNKKRAAGDSEKFEYVSANAKPKPFKLLTTAEAAIKLGHAKHRIKYLYLRGRIPHITGRPTLIDESDLAEYFENMRLAALTAIPPAPGSPEHWALKVREIRKRAASKWRAKSAKKETARAMAQRSARIADGTFKPGGSAKRRK